MSRDLYDLLPAVHRARDLEQGEPLRVLMSILQEQFDALEEDVRGLYENLFIETCEEWVVPYIGELLGVTTLHDIGSSEYSLRSFVANTLRYRRRKGTAPVLEQVARDLTGWPARAVEYFQLLGWTQYAKHTRLHSLRTPSLRRTTDLELIGTPFERASRTVEVRRIARERGKYNIPNIGLHLWRLRDHTLDRVAATPVTNPPDGRYHIDPLRLTGTMFNPARTEAEITHLAEESDVPGRLRRRPLWAELNRIREEGEEAPRVWFDDRPPFSVFLDSDEPYATERIAVCDLSDDGQGDWRRPTGDIKIAIDPVLGRLTLADDISASDLRLTWTYASPGNFGGGPYSRRRSLLETGLSHFTWRAGVRRDHQSTVPTSDASDTHDTLADAIAAWNTHIQTRSGEVGVIFLLDNSFLAGNLTIEVRADCTLLIAAGQWLDDTHEGTADSKRWPISRLVAEERRPHIQGDLTITTPDAAINDVERGLILDGVLLEGAVIVSPGDLTSLRIAHCTLVPSMGGVSVEGGVGQDQKNAVLQLTLDGVVCGPITAAEDAVSTLTVRDSLIDGTMADAGGASGSAAGGGLLAVDAQSSHGELVRTTIMGGALFRSLEASEMIFRERVEVVRRQIGCVRYSYVPPGSQTPARFRCQPELAVQAWRTEVGWTDLSQAQQQALMPEIARIHAQIRPMFTEPVFGSPAFGQLSRRTPDEIRQGAESGSEMGFLCALDGPLREANLRASLDAYLPVGLEAGIFFVT